jgi:hypothetical protein
MRRILVTAIGLASVLSTSPSFAADAKGNFALRGLGAETCSSAVQRAQKDATFRGYLDSWLGGYLTAVNRLQGDTFDASPLMNTGVVTQIVLNVCARAKGNLQLETVAADVIKSLQPARVRAASVTVDAKAGDRTIALRQETLVALQQALARQGLDKEPATGTFTAATSAALKQYQTKAKLPATGLPDAATIVSLLGSRS